MMIKVGRMLVNFVLRQDENLFHDEHSGAWIAEYSYREVHGTRERPEYVKRWAKLGTYDSKEEAAKALYVERSDFSASYGCDAAAGVE